MIAALPVPVPTAIVNVVAGDFVPHPHPILPHGFLLRQSRPLLVQSDPTTVLVPADSVSSDDATPLVVVQQAPQYIVQSGGGWGGWGGGLLSGLGRGIHRLGGILR